VRSFAESKDVFTEVRKKLKAFRSQPTNRLPADKASTAVVPPPMKQSRTVSPGVVNL
jgi:hypothetical protein